MSLKSSITFLIIIIILIVSPIGANSKMYQGNQLTRAIQLFDKGKFMEAEPIFKMLIDEKPDDFMVNYFYGACRTENGHYSKKDLNYLKTASKEVSPLDIDYYFGIQYQAQENWEQALKHYNKYSKSASDEDLRKVNLAEKIQQCYNRENPYQLEESADELTSELTAESDSVALIAETSSVNSNNVEPLSNSGVLTETGMQALSNDKTDDSAANDKNNTNSDLELKEEKLDSLAVPEVEEETQALQPEPSGLIINFSINTEITYRLLSQFKNQEGRELFKSAQAKQKQLESTLQTLDFLREKYVSLNSRKEKDSIGQQILALENRSYELKSETNQLLMKSKALENEYWQNASEDEILNFISESTKIKEKPLERNDYSIPVKIDSNTIAIPEILVEDIGNENTSAPASSSDLIYRIQIGAYSRGIPSSRKSQFDKISLIRKIDNYTDERGVVVYTTGNLTRYEDAITMQKQVRQEGIDDAFIVPYLKGKRITLEQAKEIEEIK